METHTCPRCQTTKPLSDFHKDKNRKNGHFPYCKECNKKHSAKWQHENRERVNAYMAVYRAENQEAVRGYNNRWQAANAAYTRNVVRSRRARKRMNTIAPPTIEDINARMAACGLKCVYCGGVFEHVDHAVAVCRGGSDDPNNLVPSCATCNLRKGRADWREWFKRQHFFSLARMRRIEALLALPRLRSPRARS